MSLLGVSLLAVSALTWSQAPRGGADDALVSIPFDYEVTPNVAYVQRSGWQGRLDLLLPTDRTETTPMLVWFHGGGWTRSSKEQELLYVLPYLYKRWSPNRLVRVRGAGHGDFTRAQVSHAYTAVFAYIKAALGEHRTPPNKGMKVTKPAPR